MSRTNANPNRFRMKEKNITFSENNCESAAAVPMHADASNFLCESVTSSLLLLLHTGNIPDLIEISTSKGQCYRV